MGSAGEGAWGLEAVEVLFVALHEPVAFGEQAASCGVAQAEEQSRPSGSGEAHHGDEPIAFVLLPFGVGVVDVPHIGAEHRLSAPEVAHRRAQFANYRSKQSAKLFRHIVYFFCFVCIYLQAASGRLPLGCPCCRSSEWIATFLQVTSACLSPTFVCLDNGRFMFLLYAG